MLGLGMCNMSAFSKRLPIENLSYRAVTLIKRKLERQAEIWLLIFDVYIAARITLLNFYGFEKVEI
jgi:hypothetical protein